MTQAVRAKGSIVQFTTVTIASGQTKSNGFTIPGRIVSIHIPAGSPGTSYSFEAASDPSGTYVAVQDSTGSAISVTASASTEQYVVLEPAKFVGMKHIKLVSDVAMTADTDFVIGTAELT